MYIFTFMYIGYLLCRSRQNDSYIQVVYFGWSVRRWYHTPPGVTWIPAVRLVSCAYTLLAPWLHSVMKYI